MYPKTPRVGWITVNRILIVSFAYASADGSADIQENEFCSELTTLVHKGFDIPLLSGDFSAPFERCSRSKISLGGVAHFPPSGDELPQFYTDSGLFPAYTTFRHDLCRHAALIPQMSLIHSNGIRKSRAFDYWNGENQPVPMNFSQVFPNWKEMLW